MSIHGVNARQLQIISILKEAKCTNTAELQEELGVSRRTLRTDIAYFHRGECAGVLIPDRERILGSSFFLF